MIGLPRVRDVIVYVISRELPLKGNTLLAVGMVLWDANVYVRLSRVVVVLQLSRACIVESHYRTRMITLTFKGNKLNGSRLSIA
jgi:hypothetical protein